MARVQCCLAKANAYSATTVFPALVCAATNTELPCKKILQAGIRICQHAQIQDGSGKRLQTPLFEVVLPNYIIRWYLLSISLDDEAYLLQMDDSLLLKGVQLKGMTHCQGRPQLVKSCLCICNTSSDRPLVL